MSRETGEPVTTRTLFEIGSISKVFTATLGAQAVSSGSLSLNEATSKYLPALKNSAFDKVTLLHLATYTAGGLPLQFPDTVSSETHMLSWFHEWQPSYSPGTFRQYSNPSIGLFGYVVAEALNQPFDKLMEGYLFPALGLSNTYVNVPADRAKDYSWGTQKITGQSA